jgi:hypothetical protein
MRTWGLTLIFVDGSRFFFPLSLNTLCWHCVLPLMSLESRGVFSLLVFLKGDIPQQLLRLGSNFAYVEI